METIRLNLVPVGATPICHAAQYDEGRQIKLELYNGAAAYQIQAGDTFELNIRKPDNHIVSTDITGTEGNTYLILETSEQMCAVPGINICKIKVKNSGNEIGTLIFNMAVQMDVLADGDPSQSEIEDLDARVAEAVEEQYVPTNIVFDSVPTAGHNAPYAVTSDGIKSAIDGTVAQAVSFEAAQRAQADLTLGERIDQIIALPDGSTTADAELIDIRAGANGNVYPSAGDAVRGQFENVKDVFDGVYEGVKILPYATNPGFLLGDGSVNPPGATTKEVYTNKIPVAVNDKIKLSLSYPSVESMWLAWCTYDINGDFIARNVLVYSESKDNYNGNITIPNGVAFIVFTYRTYGNCVFKVYQDWKLVDDLENGLKKKTDNPYIVYSDGYFIGSNVSESNTDPTRAKTKPMLGEGTVTIYNASNEGYAFVLKVWSDAPYGTEVYSSGWKVSNEFSYDVSGKYYSFAFFLLPDGTTNVNLASLGASNIFIREIIPNTDHVILDLDDKIEDLKSSINDIVDTDLLPSNTVKTIAHRGDDIVAPQCTAPSYILARKRGLSIAENDLWYSEDNYLVMWHDTNLGLLGNLVDINGYLMYTDGSAYYWVHPTTNNVYTWDGNDYVASAKQLSSLTRCAGANYGVNSTYGTIGLNLDVLKRIDFGIYKGSKFAGTQILTFEEWVLLCKQLGMDIYIDRKFVYTDAVLTQAANIVKKLGMGDHASWLSLNGHSIELLRSIIPDSRCGILDHPTQALIEEFTPYNTGRGFFFNGDAKNGMTEAAIQLGLNAGFEVEVWYVDYGAATKEQIFNVYKNAVSYGVTAITTDHYRADEAFEYMFDLY